MPGTGNSWIHDQSAPLKPSPARVYDYLLGGAHNFAVDRAFAERMLEYMPNAREGTRINRAFMRRAVLFMVERGIRQFLDLGSGIPTVGNVHEIVQRANPGCRVIYVDNDDVAVAHAKMMLEDNDSAAMVQADATQTSAVLDAAETRRLIDFDEPLGLLAIAMFHYVAPSQDPHGVLRRYRQAMATGSYLAISHAASDFEASPIHKVFDDLHKSTGQSGYPRTRAEVLELFDGFELVEPGLVTPSTWRPDWTIDPKANPEDDLQYAGVGCKQA